ncbi:MAG: ABC transporter permease [Bacteroidia bacterium]|nr:ABC transporter permease [Bacteroidia bacterium]
MLKTAIKFLLYDKAKSFGALLGVVISTFLIGQQIGVFTFLTNAMKALAEMNPQYIWVIDSQTENVNALGQLDMRISRHIESFPGVANVYPVFIGGALVQFPDGENSGIQLIGLEAPGFVGGPKPSDFTDGTFTDLLADGAVCVDYFDKRIFRSTDPGTTFEINKKKVYIGARTKGVRGFGASYVFTTIERARALTRASSNTASAFLVEVAPGTSQDEMVKLINSNVFGVRAWKGTELASSTVSIILRTTSIATSVGTLVIFALIAGFFIVGLTLYSAAVDRLKDYGTMKAIGATNGYIAKLIYLQATIFAIFGFGIGYLLMDAFRKGIANTGLFFSYSPQFLAVFFGVILLIALGGASFAVRRITKLEPAEVFRF